MYIRVSIHKPMHLASAGAYVIDHAGAGNLIVVGHPRID